MSDLSDAYATIWDGQLGCFDASTITIDGMPYAVDEGERQLTNSRTMEGIIDGPTCMVAVKAALFATMPALQKVVSFRNKNYKLDRISVSPDQTVWTFYLEPMIKR